MVDTPAEGAREAPSGVGQPPWVQGVIAVLATFALIAALKVAQPFVVPLLMAAVVTAVIAPAVGWLDRYLPLRTVPLVVLASLLAAAGALWYAAVRGVESFIRVVAGHAPALHARLLELTDTLERAGVPLNAPIGGGNEVGAAASAGFAALQGLLAMLGQSLFVVFLIVFVLAEARTSQNRMRRGLGEDRWQRLTSTVSDLAQSIRSYLLVKTVASAATGVLTGLVSAAVGLDRPLLWGMAAFGLNFLPIVGSAIAVMLPTAVAVVQLLPMSTVVLTAGSLFAVQLTVGSYLEPRIAGRHLAISPALILVSIAFWGWMWGAMGVFLAIPLVLIIRSIAANVPGWERLSWLTSPDEETGANTPPDESVRGQPALHGALLREQQLDSA